MEINTKAKLNMNAFLNHHQNYDALTGDDLQISIICADDYYQNIEALRLVFQNLRLQQVCHFFNNGLDVISHCKKNVEDKLMPQQRG